VIIEPTAEDEVVQDSEPDPGPVLDDLPIDEISLVNYSPYYNTDEEDMYDETND
jgi:hypothetical protein